MQGLTEGGSRFSPLANDGVLDSLMDTEEASPRSSMQTNWVHTTEPNVQDPHAGKTLQNRSSGHHVAKVHNKLGGKNPQLGPRVRDAKKVARGVGLVQQSVNKDSGHKGGKPIEIIQPNKDQKEKTLAPVRDLADIAKEIRERDMQLFGSSSISVPERKSGPSMGPKEWDGDPNPLLGFISDIQAGSNPKPLEENAVKCGASDEARKAIGFSEPSL